MSNRTIEDKAIVTDPDTLIKREVESYMKSFVSVYSEREERTNRKLDEIKNLVIKTSPGRTLDIVDGLAKWAAIIILFVLVFSQCAIADTRKEDINEKVDCVVEVVAE